MHPFVVAIKRTAPFSPNLVWLGEECICIALLFWRSLMRNEGVDVRRRRGSMTSHESRNTHSQTPLTLGFVRQQLFTGALCVSRGTKGEAKNTSPPCWERTPKHLGYAVRSKRLHVMVPIGTFSFYVLQTHQTVSGLYLPSLVFVFVMHHASF